MSVVPEETQAGAGHRPAEDSQLSHLRYVGQVQVFGEAGVAADVGERRQRRPRDGDAPDGQPVQAVGQVDGIRRPHQNQHNENHKRQNRQRIDQPAVEPGVNHQVRPELLEEGKENLGGIHPVAQTQQGGGDQNRDPDLQAKLGSRAQAQVLPPDNFAVIVGEANGPVGQQRKQRQPEKAVGQIGPQQRRHHNAHQDQHAAHGGGAGFVAVVGAFLADVLAHLKLFQAADDPRPQHQHQQ